MHLLIFVFQNLFKPYLIEEYMDYGYSEKRKKKRDKYKEKKKHPYKTGGKYRVVEFEKKD